MRALRRSGFSVLEITLVVAIVSVVACLSVPPVLRLQESLGIHAAAGLVRSELHRARIQSITRNIDCRLRVTSAVTYLTECQTPEWTPVAFHTMPRGFTITSNNSPEFHPHGHAGPMGTISVWNQHGRRAKIVVGRSGRVRTE